LISASPECGDRPAALSAPLATSAAPRGKLPGRGLPLLHASAPRL